MLNHIIAYAWGSLKLFFSFFETRPHLGHFWKEKLFSPLDLKENFKKLKSLVLIFFFKHVDSKKCFNAKKFFFFFFC